MSRLESRLKVQRSQWHKRRIVLAVAIFLLAAVTAFSVYWAKGALGKKQDLSKLMSLKDKINILVMGVDGRAVDAGRADTVFVISADARQQKVSVVSVPRDTRVKIPGRGWDKINHAYSYGGYQLLEQAVEGLMGIKIDHYVVVNIAGFKRIVDDLGGVDVTVEKRMYYVDPYDMNGDNGGGLVIDLQPGRQVMDGNAAIQYVRYRDQTGDLGRVRRQQEFLKAGMQAIIQPDIITKIPTIIGDVKDAIKTDMSATEMIHLAEILNDSSQQGLTMYTVPGQTEYINEIRYWIPDLKSLREHLGQIFGLTGNDKYLRETKQKVSAYDASIPKNIKIVERPNPEKPTNVLHPEQEAAKEKPGSANAAVHKTAVSDSLQVQIINASGDAAAGGELAGLLRARGFKIGDISGMMDVYNDTVVIANTTERTVLDKLTGLPFKYTLQVNEKVIKGPKVVVIIGKNYLDK
jgi:LCP family protein required for cell wall assembly